MKLELKNVSKTYGKREVVHNLSISLEKGIYGFLGPNGAGKSTTIRMICGLENPDRGEVLYNGIEIGKLGEKYREIIGYVPQKAGYYPDFTVYKFLEYISELKGIPDKNSTISSILEQVGLKGEKKKKMRHLSGGMKQRVSIAQALLNDPELLILDEPTVGLDPNERLHFKNIISDMSYNKIILFATHIVSDVEDIAGRVLIIGDGNIMADAETQEMLNIVKGKVWLYEAESLAEANAMKQKYKVGSIKNKNGKAVLRIISDEQPCNHAEQAEELLEDVYLSFFEGRM